MKNFSLILCTKRWDLVTVVPHWEKDASAKFFMLRQGDQFCYDAPSPGEFIQVDWIRF